MLCLGDLCGEILETKILTLPFGLLREWQLCELVWILVLVSNCEDRGASLLTRQDV